jgi:hypothetical protein
VSENDAYRAGAYDNPNYTEFTCCSNDCNEKALVEKQFYTLKNARNGGTKQAMRRILSQLPYSPQSLSSSIFFDSSLFSYDEKIAFSQDRPRAVSEYPIKFFDRHSGKLRFKLLCGLQSQSQSRIKYLPFIQTLRLFYFPPDTAICHLSAACFIATLCIQLSF